MNDVAKEIADFIQQFEVTWPITAVEGRKMGQDYPNQWDLGIFKMAISGLQLVDDVKTMCM
jgi:hypothetical protein